MIIGFTGASATGKSWAAGKLAALLGYHYQGSRGAEIAADLNFDVNAPHSFDERLGYQIEILEWMVNDLCAHENAVFDRTPIDLMAFSILAHNDEDDSKDYKDYLSNCMKIADEMFDLIVLVSPPYEQLVGAGEYKPGRLCGEVHGYNFRVLFDKVVKTLLDNPKLNKKLLIIPEDVHYEDRVKFVMEHLSDNV